MNNSVSVPVESEEACDDLEVRADLDRAVLAAEVTRELDGETDGQQQSGDEPNQIPTQTTHRTNG